MSTPHRLFALALAVLAAAATPACSKGSSSNADQAPRVPASSDPTGKDVVEGAVVAAKEGMGGVRLYKVTHVEEMPDPLGKEFHLIAYDPRCDTFEQAAQTWQRHETKVIFEHLVVRDLALLPRDHRVLLVEPLTPDERSTYTRSRDSRGDNLPPTLPQPR